MLLVLVFGISASFASDADDSVQATDESADTVSVTNTQNTTLTDSGSDELPDNLGATNEERYISSNNDVLTANPDGSFTDLANSVKNGGTVTLDRNYVYTESKDSSYIYGVNITKPITINGNGYTLNGNGLARILNVNSSNVILKNINFINGYVHSKFGSSVLIEGDNCLVSSCSFKNSFAESTSSNGAGTLAVHGAYNSVIDCKFENNKAYHGSAIMWGYWSPVSLAEYTHDGLIENCVFINNNCTGSCGAVNVHGPKLTVKSCNFTGNDAQNTGALRFYNTADYAIVTNCNFEGNTARTNSGALVVENADGVYLSDCKFIGNAAGSNGGAVQWTGINGVMTNCYFESNTGVIGGAVVWSGDNGILENTIFKSNSATSNTYGGGAIRWNGNYGKIDNVNFTSNNANTVRADNTEGGDGGALEINGHYLSVTNCDFTDNTAADLGGAIFIMSSKIGTSILDCNFNNNDILYTNRASGGAIGFWSGTSHNNISNCSFENSDAKQGGAIYMYSTSQYNTIDDCTFTNNKASSGDGGAIYASNQVTITNTDFKSNSATQNGGAAYIPENSYALIEGNTYSGNTATTNPNIDATNLQTLTTTLYIAPIAKGKKDGSDANNAANWTYAYSHIANGGTIYFTQGTYTDIVNQNVAKTLNLIGLGTVTIDLQQNGRAFTISSPNSLVKNINFKNGMISGSGGAIYWSGTYGTLKNSNFDLCYASTNGGGIYWASAYGLMENCNFDNCFAQRGSGYYWAGAYGVINNTNLKNSNITHYGNGYINAFNVIMDNCLIDNCFSPLGNAALVFTSENGKIFNSNFTNNNNTKTQGYSVIIHKNNVVVDNCYFINNTGIVASAIGYGSGPSSGIISNSHFINNWGVNGSAISIVFPSSGDFMISNCVFEDNIVTDNGVIYIINNSVTLKNNEFSSNIGNDIYVGGEVNSDLLFIRQGATGSGLIESDPTNWTYAINHINNGGKIVFLQSTYSDLINLSKNRIKRVIL